MITGAIDQSRYPRLLLELVVDGKREKQRFLLDTGFDGEIALSYGHADELGLEPFQFVLVTYANGQSVEEIMALCTVVWFGVERNIRVVLSSDNQPAIGTRMLEDCVVTLDFSSDILVIAKHT